MSLNGKIADTDGNVGWLERIPNPEKTDYGYIDFYNSIDTTIQGYSTYEQIMGWGIDFPYSDKKNYVLTRKKGLENTEDVDFISDNHINFIRELKQEYGEDIWLIGGGQVNTLLLNTNLIDEIKVFIIPIIIPNGIGLFENMPNETHLKLINQSEYSNGVVQLDYNVVYE